MTYGLIDEKNFKIYTYLSAVFEAIDDVKRQYNWLIADCVCYPENKDLEELFDREYCWLSGDELSEIVAREDFQWIWGVLCGFEKHISPEEVLKYPLPSVQDYNGYYHNPLALQHPLAVLEIAPCDSSWLLILSKDKAILDSYRRKHPKAQHLTAYNEKHAGNI